MPDIDSPRVTPARPSAPRPSAVRRAAPALLGFAAVRTLGLAVLALWSAARDTSARTLLTARWDAIWYARIAESGYGHEVRTPDGGVHSDLAFFPLLPWLERLGAAVSPLSHGEVGFVVSVAASFAAAWGIYAVAERLYGDRVGLYAVLLWAVLPVGVVQSMAYSESLFTALAAWSLHAVSTGRWIVAGALASLAGLTRPVGVAVVAAVWAGALVAFPRGRDATERAAWAHRLTGLALAPLGSLGYVLWVGRHTGTGPLGYLDVQHGWGNGFDGGYAFARFVAGKLASAPTAAAGLALVVGVLLVLWLYATCLRQRQPIALVVYTGAVVGLALCASGYFGSKPRLLLPAFPLLLPPALALARRGRRAATTVVALSAVASALYGAFWLNGSGPP
ncbi:glycosyltransferase family 39 protein [Streptomyces sp. ZYX-F-203]